MFRAPAMTIVLALFGALGVSLGGTPAGARAPLRILTFNIRHGEGTDGVFKLARVADVINAQAPDLVALQEVDRGTRRVEGADQPAELARLTGLHGTFGKAMDYDGGEYGLVILSRW